MLALAGFFIRQLLEKQEDERRKLSERQEDERRKHEALKDYLDDITSLFLSDSWEKAIQEKLRSEENESPNNKTDNQKVFAIAKARTLAALNELDKKRQVQLIRFLSESRQLVNFTFPGIGIDFSKTLLSFAHIEGAELVDANFQGASLVHSHLEQAVLYRTHLEGANLEKAHFEGAYLGEAHLEGAYLVEAHFEGAYLINITWDDKTNWTGVTGLDSAHNIPEGLKPHLIEIGVLSPETENPEEP